MSSTSKNLRESATTRFSSLLSCGVVSNVRDDDEEEYEDDNINEDCQNHRDTEICDDGNNPETSCRELNDIDPGEWMGSSPYVAPSSQSCERCTPPLMSATSKALTMESKAKTSLLKLKNKIRHLGRVAITGQNGEPVFYQCPLSEGQTLQPAGRWKYGFASRNGNSTLKNSETQLSPHQLLECELWIGSVMVQMFRPHHVVNLFQFDPQTNSVTITIAAEGNQYQPIHKQGHYQQQQQLAIIAMISPLSKSFCRTSGLVNPGDSASLQQVCTVLSECSPTSQFLIWSIGIPATLMSETLFSNIIHLPGVTSSTNNTSSAPSSRVATARTPGKHFATCID